MYMTDPLVNVTTDAIPRVLGGEACLWGELVSSSSLDTKTWPRAAAYGGRLWAYEEVQSAR